MSKISNAIHESGHCLALHHEGRRVSSVSLDPPVTRYRRYDVHSWNEAVSHLFCIMAGAGAEYKWQGKPISDLAFGGTDAFASLEVLRHWTTADRKQIVDEALHKTERWLDGNYGRIELLAKSLYRHGELSRDDLEILL